jgi:hypothetical protein
MILSSNNPHLTHQKASKKRKNQKKQADLTQKFPARIYLFYARNFSFKEITLEFDPQLLPSLLGYSLYTFFKKLINNEVLINGF